MVQPKTHPRHHDDHEGWNINGDYVVLQLPFERHIHCEAAVIACMNQKRHLNFAEFFMLV